MSEMESVRLKHLYGKAYVGSAASFGRVELKNAKVVDYNDNGFIRGPGLIQVIDPNQPASIVAKGGDVINDVRHWGEHYIYTPGHGWTEQ